VVTSDVDALVIFVVGLIFFGSRRGLEGIDRGSIMCGVQKGEAVTMVMIDDWDVWVCVETYRYISLRVRGTPIWLLGVGGGSLVAGGTRRCTAPSRTIVVQTM